MTENRSLDLSRVMVVGTSCSGKTTFARALAGRLGVPHFELDAIYWLPDWREREAEEFKALVSKEASSNLWVTDGNYRVVRDILFKRATAVIWLNFAFPLTFWRAVKRTVHRALTGQKICGDNRESIRIAFFSRQSIILWVLTTYRRRKRQYRTFFDSDAYAHIAKIELTNPEEARTFLQRIERA